MIQASTIFPSIDYAAHPAFHGFAPARASQDAAIEEAIRQADAVLEEIHSSPSALAEADIQSSYQTRVLPQLDAIGRLTVDSLPGELPIAGIAATALAETREELLKEALFQNEKKRYRPAERVTPSIERIARDLSEEGLSLHRIPQPAIEAILDDVGEYRQRLTELSSRNGGMNCALALPHSGRFWSETQAFLDGAGIIAGCSLARRQPLELAYCALVLSHDGEQWWRDCYQDAGLATARTVYMHNDKDYDIMKVLVYLSEVDEARGPFCFVRGSHKWRRSRTQSFFFKAFDAAANVSLAPREPVRTVYYRKAFHHPVFREQFLKLPRPLRGSSHFGDDVLDDSDLSGWLLERETAVTSDMANCMAFIGADGIHRGGCVRKGQRWALQLGLRKTPPLHRRIERRAKAAYALTRSKLRGAVRRFVGERGAQSVRSLAQRVSGR
jgi:hypothetical protein